MRGEFQLEICAESSPRGRVCLVVSISSRINVALIALHNRFATLKKSSVLQFTRTRITVSALTIQWGNSFILWTYRLCLSYSTVIRFLTTGENEVLDRKSVFWKHVTALFCFTQTYYYILDVLDTSAVYEEFSVKLFLNIFKRQRVGKQKGILILINIIYAALVV